MWTNISVAALAVFLCQVTGKLETEEDPEDSGIDVDSGERVGASVTQIVQHPYSASILRNGTYLCSGVVLNTYWLLTSSKCFASDAISSYVTHRNLGNFSVRTGSSYNNKGGLLSQIKMLINNFDMKVSAVKLQEPLTLGPRVMAVRLPEAEDEVTLGYLAAVVAWTPNGHIRVVNAPVIDASLCEPYTQMFPGNYICLSGVQDPNRHFCRKDNGGAVIQNNTLVGLSTFLHTCATYTKIHAFPKVASFARWLDSVIWDEGTRPSSSAPTDTTTAKLITNATETPQTQTTFLDPRKYLLTLPYAPINVPLEPAGDNSVIPRMSLYESYLQNLALAKTSTTPKPKPNQELMDKLEKRAWLRNFGNVLPRAFQAKYDPYEYN